MRRREFITLLGGAAMPLAARAQERVRHVILLAGGTAAGDVDAEANKAAVLQTLQQLGWIEGRNLRLDVRWGGGNPERIRHDAADMAALAPDVVLVSGVTSGQQGGDFHGWLAGSPWLITGLARGSPIRDEPCHTVAHGGG